MSKRKTDYKVSIARPIQTIFYQGSGKAEVVVRVNRARWANNAVAQAVKHMQINEYDATVCEVFDTRTGTLLAVIRRYVSQNKIEILYKRKDKEDM